MGRDRCRLWVAGSRGHWLLLLGPLGGLCSLCSSRPSLFFLGSLVPARLAIPHLPAPASLTCPVQHALLSVTFRPAPSSFFHSILFSLLPVSQSVGHIDPGLVFIYLFVCFETWLLYVVLAILEFDM